MTICFPSIAPMQCGKFHFSSKSCATFSNSSGFFGNCKCEIAINYCFISALILKYLFLMYLCMYVCLDFKALADKSSSDIDEDDGDHELYEEEANEEMNTTTTPLVSQEESVINNPLINRKKSKKACNKKIIENRMDEAYNILNKVSNAPISDEYSLYSELLAKKLRNLKDDNTREFAMYEIDNFLYALKHNNTEALTRFSAYQYRPQQSQYNQTPQAYLAPSFHSQPTPHFTNLTQHYQTTQRNLAPSSCPQPSPEYTDLSQHYQTPQRNLAPSPCPQPSPEYTDLTPQYQTPQRNLAPSPCPQPSPEYTNLSPQYQKTYLVPLPRTRPSPEYIVPSPQNHVASLLNSQISSDISNSQSSNINVAQNKRMKTSVPQNELSFDGLFKKS